MRRIHLGVLLGALPVLTLCLFLGCKSDDESDPQARRGQRPNRHPGEAGSTGGPSAKLVPVKAGKATFSGRILLEGSRPNIDKLNQELMAEINKNQDASFCKAGGRDALEQEYRISETSPATVGNVFVYLEPMDGQFFEMNASQYTNLKNVEILQPHCAFRPHCATVFSVRRNPSKPDDYLATGQKLVIINNAPKQHNTAWNSQESGSGNVTLSANGGEKIIGGTGPDGALLPESKPIRIECNIHGWMKAWVWPFDHPYATVSAAPDDAKSKDFGTFEMKNVPAGKVKVHVYHEKTGDLFPDGEVIDFSAGKDVKRDFKIQLER